MYNIDIAYRVSDDLGFWACGPGWTTLGGAG